MSTFRQHQIQLSSATIHAVESGPSTGPSLLLLHGWPQTSRSFEQVMRAAGDSIRTIAIDLPGVGKSRSSLADGRKSTIAQVVHELVSGMNLNDVTLVGHDIGGQVVFAYLAKYADEIARAVIMNVVIPGLPPWEEVLRNPYIWHFAFHNIPGLPETLVADRQGPYFDYFFDTLTKRRDAIPAAARQAYVDAYSEESALKTGFDWYRAFEADAKENATFAAAAKSIATPVLYIRGTDEGGNISEYTAGLRSAGLEGLHTALIPGCGHYTPEESPAAVWSALWKFITS